MRTKKLAKYRRHNDGPCLSACTLVLRTIEHGETTKLPAIRIGVRPGELVGHQPCSITLCWLVRVRPAPPRSRLQPEKPVSHSARGKRLYPMDMPRIETLDQAKVHSEMWRNV